MQTQRVHNNILVRPFVQLDEQSFYEAVRSSVESLTYWFPWCHTNYSQQDASTWMASCLASWEAQTAYPMGIFDAQNGKVIGGTGLDLINRSYNIANLGYWLAESYRGKGLTTLAAAMAVDIGFKELKFTRIEIAAL